MLRGYMDLPTFAYFDFGNTWSGSLLRDFNYRIEPHAKDEPPCLRVFVWFGDICFDLAEEKETFEEEFSDEGYQRVVEKLNKRIDNYRVSIGQIEKIES